MQTIVKGTGQENRIGDQILVKSIEFHLLIIPQAAWFIQETLTKGRIPTLNILILNVREPQALVGGEAVDVFGRWQIDRSLFVTPSLTYSDGSPLSSYPFFNNSLVKNVNILKHIRIPLHRYMYQQGQTTSNVGTDSTYKYIIRQFVRKIHLKFRRGLRVQYSTQGDPSSENIMTNDVNMCFYVDCVTNAGGTSDVLVATDYVVRFQDS